MGWVLFRQGHGAGAEPYLSGAYADPRGGDIAAHLGEVLWRLGKAADAETIWDEASIIDGENRWLKETRQRLTPDRQTAPAKRLPVPTTRQPPPAPAQSLPPVN